jgi:3-hydroxyacyl-CoA dehydrogenase/enoyl-CoA hydratase/3-hydroxybutyryl-CoA epimerase
MHYESSFFRVETVERVATLWFDYHSRPANTLTLPILNELSTLLDRLATTSGIRVVLLRSGVRSAFCSGFDLSSLQGFASSNDWIAYASRGQQAMRKLASLPMPTVAVVEGECVGVGLDLALACTYRIAVESVGTRFRSTELVQGMTPCWGSTRRLPALVGIAAAWRIWTGEIISSETALTMGLVNQITTSQRIEIDLQTLTDRLSEGGRAPSPHRLSQFWNTLPFTQRRQLRQLRQKTTHSPVSTTQRLLLETMEASLQNEEEGLAAERSAAAHLAPAEGTRHLLQLHHRAEQPFLMHTQPLNPIPPRPKRVAIVAFNEEGEALAHRLTALGCEVILQLPPSEDGRVIKKASIQVTSEWVGFDNADLVLLATGEDLGLQRNLIQFIEEKIRPRVIIATTGTCTNIEALQSEAERPERLAGIHWPKLDGGSRIVEVVGGPQTDAISLASLGSWLQEWGYSPIQTADRPGRLVDLIAMNYLAEGVALVAEGLLPDEIDRACREFSFARGPLEWCDQLGFAPLAVTTNQLQLARGDSFARGLLFERFLQHGLTGKTADEGFYRKGQVNEVARMIIWNDLDDDARTHYIFDHKDTLRDGIERIILRTINEAAACLADEPDADPVQVDLALALGMGWAPSTGGPLRYADSQGLANLVERMHLFAERYGPRFIPCLELQRRAEAGEGFYAPTVPMAPVEVPYRLAG